jgi:hypothetical protein
MTNNIFCYLLQNLHNPGGQSTQNDADHRGEALIQRSYWNISIKLDGHRMNEPVRSINDERNRLVAVARFEHAGGNTFIDDPLDQTAHPRPVTACHGAALDQG